MNQSNSTFNKTALTDTQLKIIKSNIYPMYVKSGAGTGKTETLIQKILYILENEPESSLGNMVIISFANKATDEMKQRITDALYNKSLKYYRDDNYVLADKLKQEVYLVNISNISTVHAFCDNLLREYSMHVGCSPNYRIASYMGKINEVTDSIIRPLFKNKKLVDIPENTVRTLVSKIYKTNNNHGIYTGNNTYREINTPLGILRREFIDVYNEVVYIS